MTAAPRPVVLCILDGWGYREAVEHNAIAQAHTPVWDGFMARCPHSLLAAASADVGLADNQMGNSEVGHMNIGAGRVVAQVMPRIDQAIADGALAGDPILAEFAAKLRQSKGVCHILGIISDGGVHSHLRQIAALARIVAGHGVAVMVHVFTDGRDVPPSSAKGYIADFIAATEAVPGIRIATVTGRYYAMDRDNRWDRIALAYDALVSASGTPAEDALAAVDVAYGRGETDEFMLPAVIGDYSGMAAGDGLLSGNFRADRMRQILAALVDPEFDDFARASPVAWAAACGMVEYSSHLNGFLTSLFPSIIPAGILGEVVADAGLAQLRIAETEKYAHVTFFLNGGREELFPGEERIMVPSPKVATYDLQPEMSAGEVTDRLVEAIASDRFGLVVVNYANCDMIGHTGNLDATIRAVETIDGCLERLGAAVLEEGGALLITADHGNAEMMFNHETGQPHPAHTTNPVPLIAMGRGVEGRRLADGRLADIAPTVLDLMGLAAPAVMTGKSLLGPRRDPA
jgi:2,3-bisphosphoglycerate-independent phosphoglycerate mutase